MLTKVFEPVKGSHLSREQAKVYGPIIDALEKRLDGGLTSEDVLEEAREGASLLHDFFEWNDSIAAEEYRKRQAGYLIRGIKVTIINKSAREELGIEIPGSIRAFHSLKVPESEEPVYVSVDRIAQDVELRRQLMEKAWKELISWKERYKKYQEFDRLCRAIDILHERRAAVNE